jgi:hypothetical protein
VPKVKKVFLTQEGTFVKDEIYRGRARLGPRFEIMEFEFETRNFDELNLEPTFVKIDVQGLEMGVIKGMRETLKKYHPILMIENNLKMVYIADMLNKLDYALYAYDRKKNLLRRHIDSRTCNIFAVPSQRGKNARVMETVTRRIEPYTPEEKKAL